MKKTNCSVEGCEKGGRVILGYCGTHYRRWKVYGDVHKYKKLKSYDAKTRFNEKLDKTSSELGCWLWKGNITRWGYGQFNPGTNSGRTTRAHRYSYEEHNKLILTPDTYVDHKYAHLGCPKHCVNPEHLRIATNSENQQNSPKLISANKSGHRGVSWVASEGRWRSAVIHKGKTHFMGNHPPYELHVAGYKAMMKRIELYTHNELDRSFQTPIEL